MKKKNLNHSIYVLVFMMCVGLLSYICLYKLGVGEINDWDEARHGVSGYEMLKNKEWIVTTYNGVVDYWNLKPPLSEYFITLGYKLFGFNPLGMRLYSAIAMIVTAVVSALFAYKYIGKSASLFVLVSYAAAVQLVSYHGARAGDADSLYVMFYAFAVLFLIISEEKEWTLYLSCLSFSLAFLTKSWHAGTIAIFIGMYLVCTKRIFRFSLKNWILCFVSAVGPIAIWAGLRFAHDGTAFFVEMVEYDLLNRSSSALEGHVGHVWYYAKYLLSAKSFWGLFIMSVVGLVYGYIQKNDEKIRKMISVLILSILVPFLLFSMAKTKLSWYVFCIYPPLIILGSYGVEKMVIGLKKDQKKIYKICIMIVTFIFICIGIAGNIVSVTRKTASDSFSEEMFSLLKRNDLYSGITLYRNISEEKESWRQSEVLAVELAGDMKPENGELLSWYEDLDAYLITTEDLLLEVNCGYEVVNKIENKYVLKHKEAAKDEM